jgi:hypothetical protein
MAGRHSTHLPTNAGLRWSTEEHNELIHKAQNTPLEELAKHFERTVSALSTRIKQHISSTVDDENTLEELCQKYHVAIDDMLFFIEREKQKDQTRKEPIKKQVMKTVDTCQHITNNNLNTQLLTEIRDLLNLIVAKLNS